MALSRLTIINCCGYDNIYILFDRQQTLLIGRHSVGKTRLLNIINSIIMSNHNLIDCDNGSIEIEIELHIEICESLKIIISKISNNKLEFNNKFYIYQNKSKSFVGIGVISKLGSEKSIIYFDKNGTIFRSHSTYMFNISPDELDLCNNINECSLVSQKMTLDHKIEYNSDFKIKIDDEFTKICLSINLMNIIQSNINVINITSDLINHDDICGGIIGLLSCNELDLSSINQNSVLYRQLNINKKHYIKFNEQLGKFKIGQLNFYFEHTDVPKIKMVNTALYYQYGSFAYSFYFMNVLKDMKVDSLSFLSSDDFKLLSEIKYQIKQSFANFISNKQSLFDSNLQNMQFTTITLFSTNIEKYKKFSHILISYMLCNHDRYNSTYIFYVSRELGIELILNDFGYSDWSETERRITRISYILSHHTNHTHDLLLFSEPTQGLSVEYSNIIQKLIEQYGQNNNYKQIVYVTHNLYNINKYHNNVYLLLKPYPVEDTISMLLNNIGVSFNKIDPSTTSFIQNFATKMILVEGKEYQLIRYITSKNNCYIPIEQTNSSSKMATFIKGLAFYDIPKKITDKLKILCILDYDRSNSGDKGILPSFIDSYCKLQGNIKICFNFQNELIDMCDMLEIISDSKLNRDGGINNICEQLHYMCYKAKWNDFKKCDIETVFQLSVKEKIDRQIDDFNDVSHLLKEIDQHCAKSKLECLKILKNNLDKIKLIEYKNCDEILDRNKQWIEQYKNAVKWLL